MRIMSECEPPPLDLVLEAKFESPEWAASVLKCSALFSTLLSLYSHAASPSVSNDLFKNFLYLYVYMHVEVHVGI